MVERFTMVFHLYLSIGYFLYKLRDLNFCSLFPCNLRSTERFSARCLNRSKRLLCLLLSPCSKQPNILNKTVCSSTAPHVSAATELCITNPWGYRHMYLKIPLSHVTRIRMTASARGHDSVLYSKTDLMHASYTPPQFTSAMWLFFKIQVSSFQLVQAVAIPSAGLWAATSESKVSPE